MPHISSLARREAADAPVPEARWAASRNPPACGIAEEAAVFEGQDVDRAIGRRVRLRRQQLGVSQKALAAQLGVSFQQVQKYERGTNRVSASTLVRIAAALDCSPGAFFGHSGGVAEGLDGELLGLLGRRGAADLLRAYGRIARGDLRQAVLLTVEALAAREADDGSR